MNDTCIIICTRPESRRLERKAFLKVGGTPAIEHILNRLIGCGLPVILAVPDGCKEYEYLLNIFHSKLDIEIFYGNARSPLHRTADFLKDKDYEYFIRITHDDILIDQDTMIELLDKCKEEQAGYGVCSTIVDGAGVEVIHVDNLLLAAREHKEPTEYISYFVKSKPNSFRVKINPRQSINRDYRLTMDYKEDWILLDTILTQVGPFAPLDKICEFIDKNIYLLNLNKLPLFSVYTCAFNSEEWIDETIYSVTNQSFQDFEYLLIDDGSTDKTPLIMSKYITDKRVKFVRNSYNAGLATRSNEAISMAKGKYVIRLDADDRFMRNTLNTMKNLVEQHREGFYYLGYNEINEAGDPIKINCNPRTFHHVGGALMNKSLINEIRFTDGLRHWDSKDLYDRIERKDFGIRYIDEPIWYYRKHDKSMSAVNTKERRDALEDINGKS